MKIRLHRNDFIKTQDGHPEVWNWLLKRLGVKRKERSGVYIVILDVRKASIPNATGVLFEYDQMNQTTQRKKAGDQVC